MSQRLIDILDCECGTKTRDGFVSKCWRCVARDIPPLATLRAERTKENRERAAYIRKYGKKALKRRKK